MMTNAGFASPSWPRPRPGRQPSWRRSPAAAVRRPRSSDAVVVPDRQPRPRRPAAARPRRNRHGRPRRPPLPAAATPALAARRSRPRAGARSRGRSSSAGNPPAAKVLVEKGKAAKDPEVCAKDAPINSERLVVDGATKGVKNVLVYIPKPTTSTTRPRRPPQAAKVVFDQEKCVFEPHVLGVMTGTPVTLKSSDPVNHNVNAKLKNNPPSTSCSPRRQRRSSSRPSGGRTDPGRGHLRYPSLDAGLVDGPRSALLRRDRREGELRDQERAGRHAEGRRLAGGGRQERFVTAPPARTSSSRRTTRPSKTSSSSRRGSGPE